MSGTVHDWPLATAPRGARRLSQRWRAWFAIDPRETRLSRRGFAAAGEDARLRLERIGAAFVHGLNNALPADDAGTIAQSIEQIDLDHRGFAVEGAAMGAALADALTLSDTRLKAWMARCGGHYSYLAHVGAGWALARAPWRMKAVMACADNVHGWLVFDGMGFHDAYFSTARIFRGWRRERGGYGARVYDQGIGRALWFVAGGSVAQAAMKVARFDAARHADLFSGLGLALAYAGGASPDDLRDLRAAAGPLRGHVAQGAAFAAEAHARARHMPRHTAEAVQLLAGRYVDEAVALVRETRAQLPAESVVPPYEQWRRDVRRALS